MRKVILVFAVFLAFCFNLYSQVIIKEKVEIKPQQKKSSVSPASAGAIYFQANSNGCEMSIIPLSIPCMDLSETQVHPGGSYSVPAEPGYYYIQARFLQPVAGEPVIYSYEATYGGQVLATGSGTVKPSLSGSTSCFINVGFNAPIYDAIMLNIPGDELGPWSYSSMSFSPFDNCPASEVWTYDDDITLSIPEGSEYLSFYEWNGEEDVLIGDEITMTYRSRRIEYITIVNDEPLIGDEDLTASVRAEVNGIISEKKVTVFAGQVEEPVILNVRVEPPVVSAGDTTDVIIEMWDYENSIFIPIQYMEYEIGIVENCGNGELMLISDGDTTRGEFLRGWDTDIIKFIAADSLETDSVIVKIAVGTWSGGGASGSVKGKGESKLMANKTIAAANEKLKQFLSNKLRKLSSVTACPISNFTSDIFGIGEVIINNSCNFAEYDPNGYQIPYILQKHDNYYTWLIELLDVVQITDVCNKPDSNQTGGSLAIPYTRIRKNMSNVYSNSWDIKPLIDEDDRLHFEIVDPDFQMPTNLIFDFVCGVCTLKINPTGNDNLKTLLNSIDDINYQNISVSDAPQAFYDFCGHNCYPQTINKYVLVEIINLHEYEHMEDYKQIVKDNYSELVSIIKNYSIACSTYNAETKANSVKVILSMINYIIDKSMDQYAIKNEAANRGDYSYERQIQGRTPIANKIGEYINKLRKMYSLNNNYNCTNCSNN